MLKLNGIFPPLPTSFDRHENVDYEMMLSNIRILNRYNLSGFLILGSNGELVNLSFEERVNIFQKCREAIPSGKIMLAGTGCQSTRETLNLSRAASAAGSDAVLVLNPSYYKGLMKSEALVKHYHEIADKLSCPVIIYNMPSNSGLDMDAETILSISNHENIIGLKDSGGNLVKMATVIKNSKPGFQVLAGSAGFLLPALSLGATGGILALANIAPARCIDIYESFQKSDIDVARRIQLEIVELNTAVTRKWGVPALKAAMDRLGLYGGIPRRPVLEIEQNIKEELYNLIDRLEMNSLL